MGGEGRRPDPGDPGEVPAPGPPGDEPGRVVDAGKQRGQPLPRPGAEAPRRQAHQQRPFSFDAAFSVTLDATGGVALGVTFGTALDTTFGVTLDT